MRFPGAGEDLTGKVCICSTGRIAVVGGRESLVISRGSKDPKIIEGWGGVGFDGKGTWFSSKPVIAFESVSEYRETLKTRFGGKMSYLG